ncbi:MAG TPA: OmpH family outer membrane protein [Chryseosolibacter sp.]
MKILVLAALGLFVSLSADAQTQAQPKQQPASAGKIGYIDVESVIVQLPDYKKLEAKLQETQKKLSDEMLTKQQTFEKHYADYLRDAKSMADSSRVKAEEQLTQMDADIRQFEADAQNTFENTKKLYLSPIYLKLGGVIREVAVENGFMMILPYRIGQGQLLLRTDATLDVSQLVLKKFGSN